MSSKKKRYKQFLNECFRTPTANNKKPYDGCQDCVHGMDGVWIEYNGVMLFKDSQFGDYHFYDECCHLCSFPTAEDAYERIKNGDNRWWTFNIEDIEQMKKKLTFREQKFVDNVLSTIIEDYPGILNDLSFTINL